MSQKEQAYNTIKGLIERFSEQYASYKNSDYNETKTRRDFIDPFFHALGWDVDNSQGYAEGYREVIHEDAIKISGQTKAPDYSFRIGGQRIFFVEAKKPSVDIKIDISPAYQVRRYAWSAKLPVSILTDFEEFAVYDCRIMPKPNDSASTARIKYYTYKDYLEKWDEIYNLFSKEAVLKGKLNEYIESKTDKRGTQEVDDLFLQEMENWRDWLAHNINLRNPDFPIRTLNDVVQKTIDRIVFLRICEDRGIEPEGQLQKLLNGVNVYARLFEIFEAADRKYNSGLFHFASDKRNENPDTFSKDLKIDDKVLKDIIKRLYYPESPYVFSEIPADILGQVYERFIGKVITINPHHKAVIEQKPEVRKAGGVYYTPSYIVDYIVKNTLGKVLGTEDRTQNYEEINYSNTAQENALDNNPQSPAPKPLTIEEADKVTVLDPACGSGSFLLNAYQYLLDWYLLQYSKNPDKYLKGKDPKIYQIIPKNSIPNPQPQTPIYKLTIQEKKRILINHIYGVDIDPQAVEVTKLSLMLKVLEGETVETLNKVINIDYERALPDLSNNIKCGNSLIGSDFYEGKTIAAYTEDELYKVNAFDWEKEFPQIFKVDKGIRSVEQSPSIVQFGTQSKTQQETVVPPAGSVEQSPSIVPYFPRKYNYSLLYDTIDTFITKQRDLPHWQLPGSVYFLTFRTFSNFELNEESRNIVYGAIHFNDNKKYKLYAFVVMSDHVHIILQPLEKAKNEFYNLSEILHGIKGYSAHKIKECILAQSETIVPPAGSVEQSPSIVQSYAQSEMIVPPVQRINTSKLRVWQHESFDRIIRNEEEFYEKMNYIANNPVKRGLVENIEEYKWFWFIGKDEDVNNRANAQSSIQSNAQPETVVPPSKSVEQ
ncbi:MAG TPA: type I restriction endonuclease, partial [Candidatus Kapabacteria bacterium]|nr:type I restriction endonuclease [Candidatus Kapabacteria bacterium]